MPFKKLTFLGIITARKGSKNLPNKNIKLLARKPLIEYTFDAVKNSKLLNRCIVSTDCDETISFAKIKNMEVPFKRPVELATDDAKSIDVLIHAVNFLQIHENYMPDFIITLQPTSPLRTAQDIDNSIKAITNDKNADSLVSVVEIPHNFNPYSLMVYNGKYLDHYIREEKIMRRQDKPIYYARNGAAIYITSFNLLMGKKRIIGDKCLPYFMPKERSIDIDDSFDFKIAEFLIKDNSIPKIFNKVE